MANQLNKLMKITKIQSDDYTLNLSLFLKKGKVLE